MIKIKQIILGIGASYLLSGCIATNLYNEYKVKGTPHVKVVSYKEGKIPAKILDGMLIIPQNGTPKESAIYLKKEITSANSPLSPNIIIDSNKENASTKLFISRSVKTNFEKKKKSFGFVCMAVVKANYNVSITHNNNTIYKIDDRQSGKLYNNHTADQSVCPNQEEIDTFVNDKEKYILNNVAKDITVKTAFENVQLLTKPDIQLNQTDLEEFNSLNKAVANTDISKIRRKFQMQYKKLSDKYKNSYVLKFNSIMTIASYSIFNVNEYNILNTQLKNLLDRTDISKEDYSIIEKVYTIFQKNNKILSLN